MHKWRFTRAMVADAPDHKGVYILWRNGVPLAVGHAMGRGDTIRSRLLSHLSHDVSVTHYSWQLCADPVARTAQLERELGLVDVEKADAGTRPSRAPASDSESAQEG